VNSVRVELLNLNLSIRQRIEQRERELQAQHERVTVLEREKATAAERARILRDMHDGAGAHLIAAIRLVEQGRAGKDELLRMLGESLDQLRLTADAMHLPAGDINALLANLRFRLDRRIRASALPACAWSGKRTNCRSCRNAPEPACGTSSSY